jgi:hypothetical protein
MSSANLHLFEIEAYCNYGCEEYLVRDNGAVFRFPRIGNRRRQLDKTWTFGTRRRGGETMVSGKSNV